MKRVYVILGAAVLVSLAFAGFVLIRHSCAGSTPGQKAQGLYKSANNLLNAGKLDDAALEFQKVIADFPDSEKAPAALLSLCEIRQRQGKLLEAKDACEATIARYSGSEFIKDAQKKLGQLNVQLLFSPAMTRNAVSYEVQPGDILTSVAKKFNTTVELLKRSNGLKSDNLRPKMQLKVYTGKFSVVVDKSRNKLILKSDEEVFKTYDVSTGKETSITPAGNFKIINKLAGPTWYTPEGPVPYGDPRNILGTRWMGFDKSGYGIHGTTDPQSIGRSVTAGCVRMYNRDVEELFDILPVGTEVTIVE